MSQPEGLGGKVELTTCLCKYLKIETMPGWIGRKDERLIKVRGKPKAPWAKSAILTSLSPLHPVHLPQFN